MSEITTPVKDRHKIVDAIEKEMAQHEQVVCPVDHVFTPGLYTRIITMPSDTVVTSEIHKTEHPFMILKGKVVVANVDTGETQAYEAPYVGVTKPNTRRVLHVIEETVWATSHVTEETDIEKIGDEILEPRDHVVPHYKIEAMKGKILHTKEIEL